MSHIGAAPIDTEPDDYNGGDTPTELTHSVGTPTPVGDLSPDGDHMEAVFSSMRRVIGEAGEDDEDTVIDDMDVEEGYRALSDIFDGSPRGSTACTSTEREAERSTSFYNARCWNRSGGCSSWRSRLLAG